MCQYLNIDTYWWILQENSLLNFCSIDRAAAAARSRSLLSDSENIYMRIIFKHTFSKECDIYGFLIFLLLSATNQEQNRTFYI